MARERSQLQCLPQGLPSWTPHSSGLGSSGSFSWVRHVYGDCNLSGRAFPYCQPIFPSARSSILPVYVEQQTNSGFLAMVPPSTGRTRGQAHVIQYIKMELTLFPEMLKSGHFAEDSLVSIFCTVGRCHCPVGPVFPSVWPCPAGIQPPTP